MVLDVLRCMGWYIGGFFKALHWPEIVVLFALFPLDYFLFKYPLTAFFTETLLFVLYLKERYKHYINEYVDECIEKHIARQYIYKDVFKHKDEE